MAKTEYQEWLRKQLDMTKQRLESAREQMEMLENEHTRLEGALSVYEQFTASVVSPNGSGVSRKSEISQQQLIFKILKDTAPRQLAVSDICRIAKDQYGRDIQGTSAGAVLTHAKKKGLVLHLNGAWSAKIEDETAPERKPSEAVLTDDSTSAEANPA